MHLLDICMSSLEKCPFSKLFVYSELLPIFKLNFFVCFLLLSCISSLSAILFMIMLPFRLFILLMTSCTLQQLFNLMYSLFVFVLFFLNVCCLCLLWQMQKKKKNYCQDWYQRVYCLLCSRCSMFLGLIFK